MSLRLLLLLVYRHVVGGRYGGGEEGLLSLSGEIANLCPTTHLELHFTPVLIKWREGVVLVVELDYGCESGGGS